MTGFKVRGPKNGQIYEIFKILEYGLFSRNLSFHAFLFFLTHFFFIFFFLIGIHSMQG